MTIQQKTAENYIALWNEADNVSRRQKLAEGWASDAVYRDPMMQGEGHEGIAQMIETAREHFPGLAFSLDTTPDGHGDFVRFSWALSPEGGEAIARGSDIVRLGG
ncbi:MAG: nuclear transport factor 2 family protein, partial [Alphaproteobacteria bacterium]